jgi:myo-inositol-1(or 4)-monophosphatase
MSELHSPRLQLACDAAREAGRLTLRYFRRNDLQIDLKGDATPVTVADREAEQLLRARIVAIVQRQAQLNSAGATGVKATVLSWRPSEP